MAGRRWLLIAIAGAALTLLIGRGIAQIYTDYLWFASLGAHEICRGDFERHLSLSLGAPPIVDWTYHPRLWVHLGFGSAAAASGEPTTKTAA